MSSGSIVRHPECAVIEEAHHRILLADAVAEGGAQHAALMLDLLVVALDELEERDDVNTEVAIAQPVRLTRKSDIDPAARLLSAIDLPENELAVFAASLEGVSIRKLRHQLRMILRRLGRPCAVLPNDPAIMNGTRD